MPVPSSITDLSQTAGSNYPSGGESPITTDDYFRSHASFIAMLRDGKGFSNPVTLASAATADIGAQSSQFVEISGTTTITSLGSTYNGPRFLRFTGALTLTHNATTLNIQGSANIITTAGDTCIAIPNVSLNGWNIHDYTRSSGLPPGVSPRATRIDVASVAGTVDLTANAPNTDDIRITGALAITGFTVATDRVLRVTAGGAFTLTNGAGLVTQTGANIVVAAGDTFMLRATAANTVEVLNYATAIPSVPASIQGAFKNLQASATGTNANVSVSADEIAVENASNAYQTLRTVSLTIAGTTTGANALDTGTIAASTWYSVWVIWNGTTTAGLLSLSATAPTMPSGYTHKARVGWVRTDGTANKYPLAFKQFGRRVQYTVSSSGNVQNLPIMASGAVGNISTPVWTAIGISNYVPTTASSIMVGASSQNASCTYMIAPNNSYGAYNSTTNPPWSVSTNNSGSNISAGGPAPMVLESTNIYWAATGVSALLYCAGWEDNL